jgi:putative transposase
MKTEPILPGYFYHIYNRGINGTDIFKAPENYKYFLTLYERYIAPIAHTYAWCLMGNHFHILVYIKDLGEVELSQLNYSTGVVPKEINASKQFGHLFNAYSQAFNKRYNRTGSLFEKPFERIRVTDIQYFRQLVFYIHNNPVHHKFCDHIQDYAWSSYGSIISLKPTKIKRQELLGYFDSVGNFIDYHNSQHDLNCIKNLMFE